MYRSFSVKHFRLFRSLTLSNLKRINFLIGKNNSGKTALLEALFLHIGCMNPMLTLNINTFRGIPGTKIDAESLWSPMFNDFNTNDEINLTAEYSDRTKSTLKIALLPSSLIDFRETDTESQVVPSPQEQLSLLEEKLLQYAYSYKDDTLVRNTRITGAGLDVRPPITPNPFPGFFIPSRYYLGPGGYATRFGQLVIKKMDYLIADSLRILEPKIQSLSVIPIGPVPTIHVDVGGSRLIPIQLTGEGMSRIAEIAIDVCSAPNGIVLVDDIDTGIHHSILPDFWKVVNQISSRVNAQLFLSTHSAECIETAHPVFSSTRQYDMKVYRLHRVDSTTKVIAYDKNTLQAAIDNGLEVR